jgi:hypothetical protein
MLDLHLGYRDDRRMLMEAEDTTPTPSAAWFGCLSCRSGTGTHHRRTR